MENFNEVLQSSRNKNMVQSFSAVDPCRTLVEENSFHKKILLKPLLNDSVRCPPQVLFINWNNELIFISKQLAQIYEKHTLGNGRNLH